VTVDPPTPVKRTVEIRERDAPRARDAEALLERRRPDGSVGMRVARLEDAGYAVYAPGHGSFRVSGDGSAIYYDELAEARWKWHRPLCAQALPLAASLHGLELVHASAVALAGQAVAFVAHSGVGKTSLAVALLARRAALVTDDVLALETIGGEVFAHPGVPMANVAAEQIELLPRPVRRRLGRAIGTSDKVHVEVPNMATGPLRLGALFFLKRSETVDRLELEPADPPDPRDLLGAAFMPHVVTPERLISQLATCAAIAATVPVLKLTAPPGLTASQLGRAVERQVAEMRE
jgi:hypothetical protein